MMRFVLHCLVVVVLCCVFMCASGWSGEWEGGNGVEAVHSERVSDRGEVRDKDPHQC